MSDRNSTKKKKQHEFDGAFAKLCNQPFDSYKSGSWKRGYESSSKEYSTYYDQDGKLIKPLPEEFWEGLK